MSRGRKKFVVAKLMDGQPDLDKIGIARYAEKYIDAPGAVSFYQDCQGLFMCLGSSPKIFRKPAKGELLAHETINGVVEILNRLQAAFNAGDTQFFRDLGDVAKLGTEPADARREALLLWFKFRKEPIPPDQVVKQAKALFKARGLSCDDRTLRLLLHACEIKFTSTPGRRKGS